jgi:hypothetical protein
MENKDITKKETDRRAVEEVDEQMACRRCIRTDKRMDRWNNSHREGQMDSRTDRLFRTVCYCCDGGFQSVIVCINKFPASNKNALAYLTNLKKNILKTRHGLKYFIVTGIKTPVIFTSTVNNKSNNNKSNMFTAEVNMTGVLMPVTIKYLKPCQILKIFFFKFGKLVLSLAAIFLPSLIFL